MLFFATKVDEWFQESNREVISNSSLGQKNKICSMSGRKDGHVTLLASSEWVMPLDISMEARQCTSPLNIQWIALKLICTTGRYLHFLKTSIPAPIQENWHDLLSALYINTQLSHSFCYALFSKPYLGNLRRYEHMSHRKGFGQTLLLPWVLFGTIHKLQQSKNDIFTPSSTCHTLSVFGPKSSLILKSDKP